MPVIFADAGGDKKAANAIAEAVITHSDVHVATKTDIATLRGDIAALTVPVKIVTGLVLGLYIGLAVMFFNKLVG